MKALSSRGEYVCNWCGFVAPYPFIDETSEHRQFALEHGVKNKSRAEFPGDDMVEDLSTGIAYDGSARTKTLAILNKHLNNDSAHNRLAQHLKDIRNIAQQMNIDRPTADKAFLIYKDLVDTGAMKGIKTEKMDAACLYHACAQSGATRSAGDFASHAGIAAKELEKVVRQLSGVLPQLEEIENRWETLVKPYIQKMRLTPVIEEAALAVGRYVRENAVCQGKNPVGTIAAILAYVVESAPEPAQRRTVEEVSANVGPKPETIRARLEDIRVHRPGLERLEEWQKLISGAY
jgi:transcription initiation factor TFIIB